MNSASLAKRYLVKDRRTGGLTLDVPRLRELSDEDFRKWELGEMRRFIANHERSTGKGPSCSACKGSIGGPKELVRYFGVSLHPRCFKSEYQEERKGIKERDKIYFDRVLQLLDV